MSLLWLRVALRAVGRDLAESLPDAGVDLAAVQDHILQAHEVPDGECVLNILDQA